MAMIFGCISKVTTVEHPTEVVLIPENVHPICIASGPYHSLVGARGGKVYTFGCGAYFRLVRGIFPSPNKV